jgi:hypothetical protein
MKILPYTTKSGLQIGCRYTPPPRNEMTAEDQLWQDVALGVEPTFSEKRVTVWVAYVIALACAFFLLTAFGG